MGGWFASKSLAGMDRNYRLLCSGFRINRIWREQVRERDLFGQWATRWRIVRTSNAYKGSPIALYTTIGMTHSRSHCGMGHLRGGSGPLQDAIEAGQGPAAVWRASGGRYRGG
jgi:hypothetical protein